MLRSINRLPALAQLGLFTVFIVGLGGCGKEEKVGPGNAVVKGVETKPAEVKSKPAVTPVALTNLHKSFKEATVAESDVGPPVEKTVTGKNAVKMYEQIAGVDGKGGLWDEIRFTTPEGKRIRYQATIKTDKGEMQVEFFPEEAPGHVRSFIALAKVGYYDGLPFHRILTTKVDDVPWTYLETGCPLGSGEEGSGSIGYWLLPEISEKLTHEEGSIGAWHGNTLESAACKFYINLTKAPWMDGNYTIFAKVTQGLDTVRRISEAPVKEGDDFGGSPKEPILMREVIIQATVTEGQVVARNP